MSKNNLKNKNKFKEKESWYIFFIVFLSVLLLLSVGLFLKNPFVQNTPTSTGLKPIGTTLNMSLDDNNSLTQNLVFNGSILPNFEIKQESYITLKPDEDACKVRAKVYMYTENNTLINMEIISTTDWTANLDGYFYLNGTLTPNMTTQFLKAIKTPPSEDNLCSNNVYSIIITYETLPITVDYQNIWNLT